MGKYNRFEICGQDRVGFTLDILTYFCNREISIVSLEVQPGRMCVMTDDLGEYVRKNIEKDIVSVNGVATFKCIELLDYEKNEKRLMAIIDAVDEGVIAFDSQYQITVFNPYCEALFQNDKQSILGTDVRKLVGQNSPLTHFYNKGEEYSHHEVIMQCDNKSIHCVSTGRIIKDDDGNVIGAVTSMKDINKVRALASIISSDEEAAFKEVIGSSAAINRVKRTIQSVAKSNSTVMLRGESGTGKELFARAIHELSGRKGQYVTINCAALPEALLESELFGYEKGSFTGAFGSKKGLFTEAEGGTIFLDEIGELPIFTQSKLLRALQDGYVRKIGGIKEERIDVRVIVATNRNLEAMMDQKLFREDLYYRLNVIPIVIPTLEARKEDIPMLINYFIHKLNLKLGKQIGKASSEFIHYLTDKHWPGNVRQLQNAIERAMNLCRGSCLTLEDLSEAAPCDLERGGPCDGRTSLQRPYSLKEIVREYEKGVINDALKNHKSIRATAKALGISHTALISKMK